MPCKHYSYPNEFDAMYIALSTDTLVAKCPRCDQWVLVDPASEEQLEAAHAEYRTALNEKYPALKA